MGLSTLYGEAKGVEFFFIEPIHLRFPCVEFFSTCGNFFPHMEFFSMGSQNKLCTMIGHFQGGQNFPPKVSELANFYFCGSWLAFFLKISGFARTRKNKDLRTLTPLGEVLSTLEVSNQGTKLILRTHGKKIPCVEKNFHMWKKNSTCGKKFHIWKSQMYRLIV